MSSLATDIIFVKALQRDADLLQSLPAGDVYNTTIALPDTDLDNAPLPYVIVTFDGLTNNQSTKDDYEGESDTVNISVEIAAKTRSQLATLTQQVRTTIRAFFNAADDDDDYSDLVPYDYQLTADAVNYDTLKPCYWQTLRYQCDILNNFNPD